MRDNLLLQAIKYILKWYIVAAGCNARTLNFDQEYGYHADIKSKQHKNDLKIDFRSKDKRYIALGRERSQEHRRC